MTTYFVGGELDSVSVLAFNGVSESQGAGTTGGYNRGGIHLDSNVGSDGAGVACWLINPSTGFRTGATGTIWTHFQGWISNQNNTGWTQMRWVNSAGTPVFRLQMGGNVQFQGQLWNGSAWTNVGSPFGYKGQDFSTVFDICLTIGTTTGQFRFIQNSVEAVNVTFDSSAITDIARVDFGSNVGEIYFTSIIVASYSTMGHTVRRRTPSGAGSNNAWVGSWDGVDEFYNNTPPNDIDGISVNAAGAKETFTANVLAATAPGAVIKAVAVGARVRTDPAAVPRHVKGVVRIGSTDYELPMDGTGSDIYTGALTIWENDPSTGAAWGDISSVNGEFGLKSDT